MAMVLRSCGTLAVALVMVAVVPARADQHDNAYLTQARESLAALEYEAAFHALEKALLSGKSDPATLAATHQLLGEVHGALGHLADAERHFRQLLALNPDATLAEGTSPKIRAPFSAAQEHVRAHGSLSARCTVDQASTSVSVHVDSDPLSMIAGARALFRGVDGSERAIETRGTPPMTLALPAAGRIELVCAVLDEHGNHLIEIGSWDDPLVLAAPARLLSASRGGAGTHEAPRSRSLFARWYLWGSLSVAAAGAGLYVGLEARADQDALDRLNRNSTSHSFSEAEEVERRGQRNALLANIAFGTAGVLAVVTAVTWGLRSGSTARRPRETAARLAPVPLRHGAGVSLRLPF